MAAALPYTNELEAVFVREVVRICQLVSTIVTLYDHLITFDQEVQLVWNKPWSIGKVMFLWIRYFGSFFLLMGSLLLFVKPPSHQFCRVWFIAQSWSAGVIVWSMQSVMMFRISAMYRHCRKIVILCSLCFAAEIISISVIFIFSFLQSDAIDEPFPGIHVCGLHNIHHSVYAFWRVPVVVFDCLLLALTLWTCIQRVQSLHGFCHSRNQIWRVLLTDSLLYFSMTVLTYISSGVLWLMLPARWRKLPQGFPVAATCVIGARLILNLRKAYYFPISVDLTPIAN